MPEFLISAERQAIIDELITKLPVIRKRIKLSQEDLGYLIGKSRQKISDIERKTAPMGWDTYLAACTALEHFGAFNEYEDGWFFRAKKLWFTK